MNYILTILFILLSFAFYYLIGNFLTHKFKEENPNFQFKIILGWLFLNAIGWLIGFPFQLLSYSWKSFFITYMSIIFLILFILLIYHYVKFKDNINVKKLVLCIKNNLKKHWFLYLLAFIFTILSVTNLQSYTINNYGDDSYIVKVVHLIGSPHLLNENYSFGNLLDSTGKFGYALQSGHRMFTTYELIYSVWSVISHISTVFFVRVTMTLHNYLICLLVFQLFIDLFINEEKSQFALAILTILFIPAGYLAKGDFPFRVRMFETWRFQTAIYMGGSIIRLCSLPLLICYSVNFLKKYKIRYLLSFILVFISLLSYQISILSYYIFLLPFWILALILSIIWRDNSFIKNNKKVRMISTSASILIFVLLMIGFNNLLANNGMKIFIKNNLLKNTPINVKAIDSNTLKSMYKAYLPYYRNVFKLDFFARFAVVPLVVLFIICKKTHERIILVVFTIIYFLIGFKLIGLFLMLSSVEFYGAARILTSIIFIVLILFGVMFIRLINFLPKKEIMVTTFACVLLIANITCLKVNYRKILHYTDREDGIVKDGFSFKPILENDKMLAQPFVEIGNYFNKLKGDKYAVFSDDTININGTNFDKQNLLLASKKIMYCYVPYEYEQQKNKEENEKLKNANWLLHKYVDNTNGNAYYLNYLAIKVKFETDNLNYILTTNKDVKNDLVKNNWHVVVGGNQKKYWLLKLIKPV